MVFRLNCYSKSFTHQVILLCSLLNGLCMKAVISSRLTKHKYMCTNTNDKLLGDNECNDNKLKLKKPFSVFLFFIELFNK